MARQSLLRLPFGLPLCPGLNWAICFPDELQGFTFTRILDDDVLDDGSRHPRALGRYLIDVRGHHRIDFRAQGCEAVFKRRGYGLFCWFH
jgi:hypothetical protein